MEVIELSKLEIISITQYINQFNDYFAINYLTNNFLRKSFLTISGPNPHIQNVQPCLVFPWSINKPKTTFPHRKLKRRRGSLKLAILSSLKCNTAELIISMRLPLTTSLYFVHQVL